MPAKKPRKPSRTSIVGKTLRDYETARRNVKAGACASALDFIMSAAYLSGKKTAAVNAASGVELKTVNLFKKNCIRATMLGGLGGSRVRRVASRRR